MTLKFEPIRMRFLLTEVFVVRASLDRWFSSSGPPAYACKCLAASTPVFLILLDAETRLIVVYHAFHYRAPKNPAQSLMVAATV